MAKQAPPADDSAHLNDDLMFSVLSASPRRIILQYLANRPTHATVDELVSTIAAEETETTLARVPEERRRSIRIALLHVHIPKLEEAALVTFQPKSELIELSEFGRKLARTRPQALNVFDITFEGVRKTEC